MTMIIKLGSPARCDTRPDSTHAPHGWEAFGSRSASYTGPGEVAVMGGQAGQQSTQLREIMSNCVLKSIAGAARLNPAHVW